MRRGLALEWKPEPPRKSGFADFSRADAIRNELDAAVELRDTPDGTTWKVGKAPACWWRVGLVSLLISHSHACAFSKGFDVKQSFIMRW